MDTKSDLRNGRYLLFLDILGFSALVDSEGPEKVYEIINDAVQCFERWRGTNSDFKTIYFSDTFLFHQEKAGYHYSLFLDIYAIGGMLLSALLARGIAARGAISFGEFEVRVDASANHQLYFGKALVEAYRAEQRENWIGITILPSAWKPWSPSGDGCKEFQSERQWLFRDDGCLMLMPFIKLATWHQMDLIGEVDKPYLDWDAPDFPNDIKGFAFLRKTACSYAKKGDFSSRVAVKYHATMAFLEQAMGEELFSWASRICDDELSESIEPSV